MVPACRRATAAFCGIWRAASPARRSCRSPLVTRRSTPPAAGIAHDLSRSRQRAAAAGAGRHAGAAPGDPARSSSPPASNADRRAAELAYATGRAAEPPPPLPAPSAAPPAAAAPPQPPGGDGAVARAYLDSSPQRHPRPRQAAPVHAPAGPRGARPGRPADLGPGRGPGRPAPIRQAEAPWAAGTRAARILRGLSVGHVRLRRGSQRLIQCRRPVPRARAWRRFALATKRAR